MDLALKMDTLRKAELELQVRLGCNMQTVLVTVMGKTVNDYAKYLGLQHKNIRTF